MSDSEQQVVAATNAASLVACLRAAEDLERSAGAGVRHENLITGAIDRIGSLLSNCGVDVFPIGELDPDAVTGRLRDPVFDEGDSRRISSEQVIVEIDLDQPAHAASRWQLMSRGVVGGEGVSSAPALFRYWPGEDWARALLALEAGEAVIREYEDPTRKKAAETLKETLASEIANGRGGIASRLFGEADSRAPQLAVMDVVASICEKFKPTRDSYKPREIGLATTVVRAIVRLMPDHIQILDQAYLDSVGRPDHLIDRVRTNYSSEPEGKILKFVREGFLLASDDEASERAATVPALAFVSRGGMSDFRRFIGAQVDALVQIDGGFGKTGKSWERRYDKATVRRGNATLSDIERELLTEMIRAVEAAAEPWGELSGIRDSLVGRLQSCGVEAIWEPANTDLGVARVSELMRDTERYRVDFRYASRDGDAEQHLAGKVLRTREAGFVIDGVVQRPCTLELSLGEKPAIVAAIDSMLDQHIAPHCEQRLEQIQAAMRDVVFLEHEDVATRLRQVRDLVLDLVLGLQNDTEIVESDEFSEFTDFLRLEGVQLFPGPKLPQVLDYRAEHQSEFYATTQEHSVSVAPGALAAVQTYGVAVHSLKAGDLLRSRGVSDRSEVDGWVCMSKARVVLSLGEKDSLSEVLGQMGSELEAIDGIDEDLAYLLNRIRDLGVSRRAAKSRQEDAGGVVESELVQIERDMTESVVQAVGHIEKRLAAASETDAAVFERCLGLLLSETAPRLGFEVYPSPNDRLVADETNPTDYLKIESVFHDSSPSGQVLKVEQRGIRHGSHLIRKAHAKISRGPRPGFLGYLDAVDAALGAGTEVEVDRIRRAFEDLWARGPASTKDVDGLRLDSLRLALSLEERAANLGEAACSGVREARDSLLWSDLESSFAGFEAFGQVGEELDFRSDQIAKGYEISFRTSDRGKGTILEVSRSGYAHHLDGVRQVLIPAVVVLSSGAPSDLSAEVGRCRDMLGRQGDVPAELVDAVATLFAEIEAAELHERAVEIDPTILAGILPKLDELGHKSGWTASELVSARALGELLVSLGWQRLPESTELRPEELAGAVEFDVTDGRFDAETPFGHLLEVRRWGWRDADGEVASKADVVFSRGPGTFLVPLLESSELDEMYRTSPQVGAVLDRWAFSKLGGVGDIEEALTFCYQLWQQIGESGPVADACREMINAGLESQDAAIFPRVGQSRNDFPSDAFDLEDADGDPNVFQYCDDQPFGTITSVEESGLMYGRRILEPAVVTISLGSKTEADGISAPLAKLIGELRASSTEGAVALTEIQQVMKRERLQDGSIGNERIVQLINQCDEIDWKSCSQDVSYRHSLDETKFAVIDELVRRGHTVVPAAKNATRDTFADAGDLIANEEGWLDDSLPRGSVVLVSRRGVRSPTGELMQRASMVINEGPDNEVSTAIKDVLATLQEIRVRDGALSDEVIVEFRRLVSRVAESDDKRLHKPAIEAVELLYRLLNDELLSRTQLRTCKARIERPLKELNVAEYIHLGDAKSVIQSEVRRLRILNLKDVAPDSNYRVSKIVRPGFVKDGKVVHSAEIEVSE